MNGGNPGCEAFWDYVDGDLSSSGADRYRGHLASCAACRMNLEEYSEVSEALRWEEEEAPPAGLREAVLEEFRKLQGPAGRGRATSPRSRTQAGRPAWPLWAAASVLLALLAVASLSRIPSRPGIEVKPGPTGEEHVVYEVYGPDGSLKAAIRTTRPREGLR